MENVSTLKKRNLNIEEAIQAMDAPTVCKMCDLVFYIDQAVNSLDATKLEEDEINKLNKLKIEGNELRDFLWNDLQVRGLEYETELKKYTQ